MKTLSEVKEEMLEKAKSKPIGGYAIFDRNGKVTAHSPSPFPHCFIDSADLEWAKTQGYETQEEDVDGKVLTWVYAKPVEEDLCQSADGDYYLYENLPEHKDEFVTEQYSTEVKNERNARISDTDDYEKLSDITVQKTARSKRESLTDEEKEEVLAYRKALRDWPDSEGFPFCKYPEIPECIAYECEQKIEQREMIRRNYEY